MSKQTLNRDAIVIQLDLALVHLEQAMAKAATGEFDEASPMVMAIDFRWVLDHLFAAWHYRFQTNEEISLMPSSA